MRGKTVHLVMAMCLSALGAPALGAAPRPQGVILIGWDGAQRAVVDDCLSRGELPNLQQLIDRGRYVKVDVEGSPDAKAGWTQVLTGYLPETTGVYSNTRYQPVPRGLSLFERLETHFGADQIVTAAVIAARQHVGEIDPPRKVRLDGATAGATDGDGSRVEEGGLTYRIIPGTPFYNAHSAVDAWEYGLDQDEKVGARVVQLLEQCRAKSFFFFVHFSRADQVGSRPAVHRGHLVSNDAWTGRIMDKLAELGLADRTQVYVTSGQSFLATNNDAVTRDGIRQDMAPTILEAFGLDLGGIEPPLDGISLTQAETRRPRVPDAEARRPDVIYVPTPQPVVDQMLKLADVKHGDVVYDLGCGDGRIVVTAAKRFGCRAYGFDIDPNRVAESLENVRENGVGDLVTIEQRDIFTLDLSEADVVTLYLLPRLNVKLIPQLEKLKPGSRIVSHDFDMQGVVPDRVVDVEVDDVYISHTIYLWTSPLKKTDPGGDDTTDDDTGD